MWFRKEKKAPNVYCPTCDGYHPVGAIRFNEQNICHIAFGKPLPFVTS